jgi:hypothetical protein
MDIFNKPRTVILNVSGTRFEVEYETLMRIPLFKNASEAALQTEAEIWVPRSPGNFQHILALAICDEHPFPKSIDYELEYYGISWEDVPVKADIRKDMLDVSLSLAALSTVTLVTLKPGMTRQEIEEYKENVQLATSQFNTRMEPKEGEKKV